MTNAASEKIQIIIIRKQEKKSWQPQIVYFLVLSEKIIAMGN